MNRLQDFWLHGLIVNACEADLELPATIEEQRQILRRLEEGEMTWTLAVGVIPRAATAGLDLSQTLVDKTFETIVRELPETRSANKMIPVVRTLWRLSGGIVGGPVNPSSFSHAASSILANTGSGGNRGVRPRKEHLRAIIEVFYL